MANKKGGVPAFSFISYEKNVWHNGTTAHWHNFELFFFFYLFEIPL